MGRWGVVGDIHRCWEKSLDLWYKLLSGKLLVGKKGRNGSLNLGKIVMHGWDLSSVKILVELEAESFSLLLGLTY